MRITIARSGKLLLLETAALLLLPLVLMLMPADYFDEGESICLSVQLFDTECYGCGLTRSIMHLLHFDLHESVYYNPLGIVVAVLVAFLAIQRIRKNLSQLYDS